MYNIINKYVRIKSNIHDIMVKYITGKYIYDAILKYIRFNIELDIRYIAMCKRSNS